MTAVLLVILEVIKIGDYIMIEWNDVLVVDGKFHGELSRVEELLAFQYHTGEPYKDFEDLESKYFEYLESYERWSFLP